MHIKSLSSHVFELISSKPDWTCMLEYKSGKQTMAFFSGSANGYLRYTNQQWMVVVLPNEEEAWANISINHHSSMFLNLPEQGERFLFKRMGFWKTRFALLNEQEEEIVALLPKINWQTSGYDFTIQMNDEYKQQLTPLIAVICLHCACFSLQMMNGEDTAIR